MMKRWLREIRRLALSPPLRGPARVPAMRVSLAGDTSPLTGPPRDLKGLKHGLAASSRLVHQHQAEGEDNCWKCARPVHRHKERFFCLPCNVVQKPDPRASYFDIMGYTEGPRYDLDLKALGDKKKELQMRLHPDRFAGKSDTEVAFAHAHSQLVNKAYQKLSDPVRRAAYILKLKGEQLDDHVAVEPEFLQEIMEENEEIAELGGKVQDNLEVLKMKVHKYSRMAAGLEEELAKAFSGGDLTTARDLTVRLRYVLNLSEKLSDLLLHH